MKKFTPASATSLCRCSSVNTVTGLLLISPFMPIKGRITILIAAVIGVLAFTADAKQSRVQQARPVLDANGNIAEYHRR